MNTKVLLLAIMAMMIGSVVSDFETALVITEIDGQPISAIYKEEGEAGYEEFVAKVADAIQELLAEIGLDESVITGINIGKESISVDKGGAVDKETVPPPRRLTR